MRTGRYHTNHPVDTSSPLPAAVRARAERRLLSELRRLQRRYPLREGVREDVLLSAVLTDADHRPPGHRGSGGLRLAAPALRSVVEAMVVEGRMLRQGHRLRIGGEEISLEPEMAGRVERLLDQLARAGTNPPPVGRLASALGVPPGVVDQLRETGRIRRLGPGIDMPAPILEAINLRLDRAAPTVELTVAEVRDALGTSRRVAAAILAARRRESGSAPQPLDGDLGDG